MIYLNHAAVAPWPACTAEAVCRFARLNAHRGAADYPSWLEIEAETRERLRQLINADSVDEIALLKNTSEALSVVAHGIDWQPGDNIVSCAREFPSNRIVWESLESQGVALRLAEVATADDPETELMALVDGRTRLMAISSIQYGTGLRLDLKRLGAFCREKGILFCVDAIQSLGAVAMDVQACHADFLMADAHKWMLGPEGIAVFYCRAGVRDQLQLRQFGWHMVQDHLNFEATTWQVADTARRFECGSPNMLGIHALHASLGLLLQAGLEEIERLIVKKVSYLIVLMEVDGDFTLLTPKSPARRGGIVTVSHPAIEPSAAVSALSRQGIICAARAGGIRLSPHYYTPEPALERAVEAIRSLVPEKSR